jgi:hypothetical protein
MVGADEVGHARLNDRVDAFDEVVVGMVPVVADGVLPGIVFRAPEQVSGVGEGRPELAG